MERVWSWGWSFSVPCFALFVFLNKNNWSIILQGNKKSPKCCVGIAFLPTSSFLRLSQMLSVFCRNIQTEETIGTQLKHLRQGKMEISSVFQTDTLNTNPSCPYLHTTSINLQETKPALKIPQTNSRKKKCKRKNNP